MQPRDLFVLLYYLLANALLDRTVQLPRFLCVFHSNLELFMLSPHAQSRLGTYLLYSVRFHFSCRPYSLLQSLLFLLLEPLIVLHSRVFLLLSLV